MTPELDPLVAGPALVPAVAAVLVLLLDALLPRARRLPLIVGAAALAGGALAAVALRVRAASGEVPQTLCFEGDRALTVPLPTGPQTGTCLMQVSPSDALLQAVALLAGLAVLVLLLGGRGPARSGGRDAGGVHGGHIAEGSGSVGADGAGRDPAVEAALLLAAVAGATALPAAADLATWLVTLELATLPIVGLVALRGERHEGGAMPLLTTSLTSFALAVVGAGLWVTVTGSLRLDAAAAWSATQAPDDARILAAAAAFLVAGVAFKLSLVPFHAWTPTTYPSAGPRLALLLATVSTVAALAALSAVVEAAAAVLPALQPALGVLAVASLLVGAVVALRQQDPVRLLAWSGITQAGWVVAPLVAGDTAAAAGYLAVYAVAALTALAAVSALGLAGRELAEHRGLARREPLVAGSLVLALLTFAGLPPGVAGLLAKVAALRPLAADGLWWVALPAVVAAVVALAVYLRWVALLLAPEREEREGEPQRLPAVVATCGGAVLVAGTVAPALLLGVL